MSAGDSPAGATLPSRDALTKAWGDSVLISLTGKAKARFGAGRFLAVEPGAAVFALPNEHYLSRCEDVRPEVEAALGAHFGTAVPLRLVVERVSDAVPVREADVGGSSQGDDGPFTPGGHDDGGSHEAPPAVTSPEERLKRAFPGAEEISS